MTNARRKIQPRGDRTAAAAIQAAVAAEELVTLPKAAAIADVSEWYMRRLVTTGRVLGVRVGRNWLVSSAAARSFERRGGMGRPREKAKK